MQYLFKNFPFAIILMIAILIMLFKDYLKPTIIFCCIPLVFVGVVAVMLLTGKTFNFVAIVGTLGLIGMIIKNGIVLMDEITLQISQGIEPVTALIDSAQTYFICSILSYKIFRSYLRNVQNIGDNSDLSGSECACSRMVTGFCQ